MAFSAFSLSPRRFAATPPAHSRQSPVEYKHSYGQRCVSWRRKRRVNTHVHCPRQYEYRRARRVRRPSAPEPAAWNWCPSAGSPRPRRPDCRTGRSPAWREFHPCFVAGDAVQARCWRQEVRFRRYAPKMEGRARRWGMERRGEARGYLSGTRPLCSRPMAAGLVAFLPEFYCWFERLLRA